MNNPNILDADWAPTQTALTPVVRVRKTLYWKRVARRQRIVTGAIALLVVAAAVILLCG